MNFSLYLLLTLANLFFSFNIVIGKVVTGVIPPITLTFLRWSGSLLILLPFCWRELKINRRDFLTRWPLILTLGFIGYSLSSILGYEAIYYSTAINVSLINTFTPIMIAVIGYILYREPISRCQLLGLILSLTGVFWIIFQGDMAQLLRVKVNTGDLFMIINVSIWPIFPVLIKYKAVDLPRLPLLFWMILASLVITIPQVIAENIIFNSAWVSQIRWVHIFGLLCLSIFPSILANHFQNTALKYVSANITGIFQSLIPVFTSVIAIIFLGEKFHLYHIYGGLLILSGVFLVIQYGLGETKT